MDPKRRPSTWSSPPTAAERDRGPRERGNVLILSFLLVALLAALSTAHFATVQKGGRQSNYFNELGELRRYADSGICLALHELKYRTGGGDGLIGTEAWTAAGDLGRDGRAATSDEGEGDGIPTPGEPGLAPVPIGSSRLGAGLLVQTTDTGWAGVKRIISTTSAMEALAALEVYALESFHTVPPVASVYLSSNVSLDVNGNAFEIDGQDTNPDGTRGTGGQLAGIATTVGDPAGSNSTRLEDQVPAGRGDQIDGQGGSPSIQETDQIDFDTIWSWFMTAPKTTVTPGEHSTGTWGDASRNDYRATYCNGDLELSGGMKGAGVLIVEGNLTMSGRSEFAGVVLVKGDVTITGGGSGVHIFGCLLVGPSASNPTPVFTIQGNSSILFSATALARASSLIPPSYSILYWNDLK